MSRLKQIWLFACAMLCYVLFGMGMLVLGLLFTLLSPVPFIAPSTKQRWIRLWIHWGCATFIWLLRTVGLLRSDIDITAMQDSASGHILIANHPTLIDAVMLFALQKDLCCFVKGSLWNNVFTGAIARLAGFIPNHTSTAVDMAVAKLQKGENLLIFPEGTRTDRDNILRFKRGASNIAVAAKAPIRPLLIKCHPAALKKGDKWYIIPKAGIHFVMSAAPLISLEQSIDTSQARPKQYRELTQFLMQYYEQWLHTDIPPRPDEIIRRAIEIVPRADKTRPKTNK